MKVKVSTLLKILLYIIVIGCENCFYLIDTDAVNISGIFNYLDFFIVLSAVFFALVYIRYGKKHCDFKFKWLILSVIPLSVLASIQANILFGQPFVMGLRPQRFWIVWGLLYFPIRRMMEVKKLTVDDLIKMVFVIGTVEIILFSLQYIIGTGHLFLYVGMNQRYGSDRYYFYNIFLRLLLFINLDRVFQKKKVLISCIYIVAVLFVLVVVGKMRMTSLTTLLAIAFGVLIWRRGGTTKIGILFAGITAAILLFNTQFVQDALSTAFEALNGVYSAASTLTIRKVGRQLYLETLKNHPLLGGGYPSVLNAAASEAAGFTRYIYLVDNGLFAFAYIYGGLGIMWVVWFFATLLRNGWKIYKKRGLQFMLLAPLGWLIAGQTEAHWYFDNGFICVTIILVILEEYLKTPKTETGSTILEKRK